MTQVMISTVPPPKPLRLPKTKKAIERYDALRAQYDLNWEKLSVEQSDRLFWLMDQASDAVREAFAEETADRNRRDQAMLVGPKDPWLRMMVEKYG